MCKKIMNRKILLKIVNKKRNKELKILLSKNFHERGGIQNAKTRRERNLDFI